VDSYPVASSARLLRHTNAAAVLRLVWDRPTFTASDVMADTGLTRSTVLALCDELVARGWVGELDDARAAGEYRMGRPARRYAFAPRAGRVVGVDAGQHHVTASVADLRGDVLARAVEELRADASPATRVRTIRRAIERALADDAAAPTDTGPAGPVLAVVLGVPAPTDAHGTSPPGNQRRFWARMNPELAEQLADVGQTVAVENDANLAAVAEWTIGAGAGLSSFATLLSGERFGAGLIVDGTLLRGHGGGAGEMRLLDLVEGVGSADGLGHVARELVRRAADAGELPAGSPLRGQDPAALDAADVFAAAQAGDAVATSIVEQLADRLARVCAVIASLLDVERIVVGGALSPALGPVVEAATERLPSYIHPPVPTVVASELGSDGVHVGAVRRALALVRANPFDFELVREAAARG